LYEALQRGAVDCTVAGTTVGVLGGFVPAAPHLVIDPSAGFVIAPGSLAVSQATWDELPLVAQQLLWDRLDVFVRSNLEDKVWPNVVDAVTQAREAGGGVSEFDDDARGAVRAITESVVREISTSQALDAPADFVAAAQASAQSWTTLVEKNVGSDWDYNAFAGGEVEAPEIDWYMDRLFGEVFLPHRPS
jgi:TRAP-type C4-dicarboxylate transport system substrate-binding protein